MTDIESAVTRLRTQQAHLRDFQRDVQLGLKKIPNNYESMAVLLNAIVLTQEGEGDDSTPDDTPEKKHLSYDVSLELLT